MRKLKRTHFDTNFPHEGTIRVQVSFREIWEFRVEKRKSQNKWLNILLPVFISSRTFP